MNDEVELKTIKSIFKNPIPVTSLKHFIGNTLGASTITEIAIAIAMLKNKKIYQPKSFCDHIDKDYIPLKTIQKDESINCSNNHILLSYILENNIYLVKVVGVK